MLTYSVLWGQRKCLLCSQLELVHLFSNMDEHLLEPFEDIAYLAPTTRHLDLGLTVVRSSGVLSCSRGELMYIRSWGPLSYCEIESLARAKTILMSWLWIFALAVLPAWDIILEVSESFAPSLRSKIGPSPTTPLCFFFFLFFVLTPYMKFCLSVCCSLCH